MTFNYGVVSFKTKRYYWFNDYLLNLYSPNFTHKALSYLCNMIDFGGLLENRVFSIISQETEAMGAQSWVIGGFVRDFILRRPSKDADIVILGDGITLAKRVAERLGKGVKVTVFKTFGTAMLQTPDGLEVEFVGARKESYHLDSRKPDVAPGTLEDDQNRRDFTVNALALSLNKQDFGTLSDPFDGLGDMEIRILRTPLDPDITFSDDPLRMMRAVRFAAQLDYSIHPETFDAIKRNIHRIDIVSKERIAEEFNKLLMSPRPSIGILWMERSGLLEKILPEVSGLKGAQYIDGKGHKDNFIHTMEVVDKIVTMTDNLWLRWAALLHDIGKPATKRFQSPGGWTFHGHEVVGSRMVTQLFKRMKLPLNEKLKYVEKLVLLHLRPIALVEDKITDSALRRLIVDAGEDLDDLLTLCSADITSKNEAKVKRYQANFEMVKLKLSEVEEKDHLRNWQPPIDGELIMSTFGLAPCKEVGIIKNVIREAILDCQIDNDYNQAYDLMLKEGERLGLTVVKNV